MLLFYAMLCYALQGAVLELSFLVKPYQPNRYDNQMALVDPLGMQIEYYSWAFMEYA